eukprot:Clim_evm93s152 gene=Clim_evmTU93s152
MPRRHTGSAAGSQMPPGSLGGRQGAGAVMAPPTALAGPRPTGYGLAGSSVSSAGGHAMQAKKLPVRADGKHELPQSWTFSYTRRNNNVKGQDYEKHTKSLGSFDTVEDFWALYSHLVKPDDLTLNDYQLFRQGIKPMWEDEANKNGGKWVLRLRKGVASRLWEILVLAMVGGNMPSDICGAVISTRLNEDILSVWTADAKDQESIQRCQVFLKEQLLLPVHVVMEYKEHQAAPTPRASRDSLANKAPYMPIAK